MQSRLITRLVAAGVALAVLIAALPGFTVEAQTRKTLKIALLTSSSTNDAAISKQALQGAQLAIEIANLGGGVVGPADDASTPTGAKRNVTYTFELVERKASTQTEMRTAIQASIEDKPVAMIGPVSAELANNNLDLANTARILQLTALPTEEQRQFGRCCGLSRSLKPNQHDDVRFGTSGEIQPTRRTQCFQQFLMDDLDDLLTRLQALLNFRADGALFDAAHEILDDWQSDIGFQERHAYLTHRGLDIFFRQFADAPQSIEDALKPVSQLFEHAVFGLPLMRENSLPKT